MSIISDFTYSGVPSSYLVWANWQKLPKGAAQGYSNLCCSNVIAITAI